jgi:hypothetical protein
MSSRTAVALLLICTAPILRGQRIELRPADPVELPSPTDSNSPVIWRNGQMQIFHASGIVFTSVGQDQFGLSPDTTEEVEWAERGPYPMWIESVWQDEDGSLFAWYHHEVIDLCPGTTFTRPEIGAAVSQDGGRTFHDLGIILRSSAPGDCNAANGYFVSGHGDFTVIPDRDGRYFYFFIGSYGGDPSEQGIAVARMEIAHRSSPIGTVWKYHDGAWDQPGLGGLVTPIFPVTVSWQEPDTDALWGPSVHWNTKLNSYVMLMNRSCCEPGWPQAGIYASFSQNVEDPTSWSEPQPVLLQEGLTYGLEWYPQVIGLGPEETDTLAGEVARMYIRGYSEWELLFLNEGEEISGETDPPDGGESPEDTDPPPGADPPEDSDPPEETNPPEGDPPEEQG